MNIFDLAYLFAMISVATVIAFLSLRPKNSKPIPRAPFSTRNNCIYNTNVSGTGGLYYRAETHSKDSSEA